MNKSWQGFTLVESLLVLWLCSLFIFVPIFLTKSWSDKIAEERFFNQFEKMVVKTQQSAFITGERTTMVLRGHQITFQTYDGHMKRKNIVLEMPRTLKKKNTQVINFISTSGLPSNQLYAVHFMFEDNRPSIKYQAQMGVGRLVRTSR